MISAWRIGIDTPKYVAEDLSGGGAKKTGGRWNREGNPLVYASSSIALACLETVVHMGSPTLPLNRYLVRIDIPDAVWAARQCIDFDTAPVGWDALPEGRVSLNFGDVWLKEQRSAVLMVPSVIVPEEQNVLINPAHPDAPRIKATKLRKWLYDSRLS